MIYMLRILSSIFATLRPDTNASVSKQLPDVRVYLRTCNTQNVIMLHASYFTRRWYLSSGSSGRVRGGRET